MLVLYDAKISEFWIELARELSDKMNWHPVFWICNQPQRVEEAFPDCTGYFVWDAFKLRNTPSSAIINQYESYNLRDTLDYKDYFTYMKILDRVDHGSSFSFSERDRLLKDHFTFWSAIIKTFQIDLIVLSNVPHLPHNYPLFLVSKQLGIPCVFANSTPLKGWYYFLHDLGYDSHRKVFDSFQNESRDKDVAPRHRDDLWYKAKTSFQVGSATSEPHYMLKQKQSDKRFSKKFRHIWPVTEIYTAYRILSRIKHRKFGSIFDASFKAQSIKRQGIEYERSNLSVFEGARRDRMAAKTQRRLMAEMDACTTDVNIEEKYIYVPLHYQPEATTAPLGELFADQIMLVEALADCLPAGWKIYVKEHYSQFSGTLWGHQGRTPGYYRKLSSIENVSLVSRTLASEFLIENCQAVATVTGTAGWEAVVRGKPCLAFGLAWYTPCNGVFNVKDPEDIRNALKAIEGGHTVSEQDVDDFLQRFVRFGFMADLWGLFGDEIVVDPKHVAQKLAEYIQLTQLTSLPKMK